MGDDETRGVELGLLAADALPTAEEAGHGPWRMRADPWLGFRRLNAAIPRDPAARLSPADLATIEAYYRVRGLVPRFQLPTSSDDGSSMALVDEGLAAAGYVVEAPVRLLVLDLRDGQPGGSLDRDGGPGPTSVDVRLLMGEPRRRDIGQAWGGDDADADRRARDLVSCLVRRDADWFGATAWRDGRLGAALAATVDERGGQRWIGIHGMRTASSQRRQGLAGALLRGVLGWGRPAGWAGCWLVVEDDNEGAVRLYEQAGFTMAARFHYRRAPTPTTR